MKNALQLKRFYVLALCNPSLSFQWAASSVSVDLDQSRLFLLFLHDEAGLFPIIFALFNIRCDTIAGRLSLFWLDWRWYEYIILLSSGLGWDICLTKGTVAFWVFAPFGIIGLV